MINHKAREGGTPDTAPSKTYFLASTSNMDPADIEYFVKWERLIDLEARYCSAKSSNLWHRSGLTLEASTSRCIGDMVCIGHKVRVGLEGDTYIYTFSRRTWAGPQGSLGESSSDHMPRSLLELAVGIGDRVLITSETRVSGATGQLHPFRHINVCSGNIEVISDSKLEVSCTKPMNLPGVINATSGTSSARVQHSSLELAYEEPSLRSHASSTHAEPLRSEGEVVIFRIDKDNSSLNFTTMRENLMRLFTGPAENRPLPDKKFNLVPRQGDEQRQRLVVRLEPPRFADFLGRQVEASSLFRSPRLDTAKGCSPSELIEEYGQLNSDQREAVVRVIAAEDYALLRGMPGTGKTATIAFVVRALVCRGSRVLITSYTHSAVDNLLLKLRGKGVPFLRVGRPSQVHPDLHDSLLDAEGESGCDSLPTVEALQKRLRSTRVLASTCLGMRHSIFAKEIFDFCIVDEAGQICQPVCLGPLRACRVFVLVGDDNQLPPLVNNPEAEKEGMGESLFSRLATAHPDAVQRLSYQYRMNEDVMAVCNELIYQNQLKCGDVRVGSSTLQLPTPDRLQLLRGDNMDDIELPPSTGWLESVLDPSRRVVFMDTDGIRQEALEEGWLRKGKDQESLANLTNPTESRLVCQLVTGLVLSGIRPNSIAVISPLRSQNKLLRRELAHVRGVEVNTVDKYQGMDKDCIILSLVRSNKEGTIGELLKDRRRINVAISRAKHKLILVGSASTLSHGDICRALLDIMRRRQWIYRLPHGAPDMYNEKGLVVVSELCSSVSDWEAQAAAATTTKGEQ